MPAKLKSCKLAKAHYYPGPASNYGQDGNFLSYIHLVPRYTTSTIELLGSRSGLSLEKNMPYFFLEATGEDHYRLLHKGQVTEYLGATPGMPLFIKPKVDEWIRVNCVKEPLGRPTLTPPNTITAPSILTRIKTYKAWVKLDKSLLINDGVCRLSIASPDYYTGDPPTVHGSCANPFTP